MRFSCPRILVAGTSGDSGKTVVTVGLARAWSRRKLPIAAFKKGPDYIDASWLSAASDRVVRNLDTFLAEPEVVKRSFIKNALPQGVNLVEGNRGLHDGLDVGGSHSSAALSKLIECPVVLVQDVTKITRSAAAFVLGSRQLDPSVEVAGVILNRVGGSRHEHVVRRTIENYCGIPVLGALPKLPKAYQIPSRHLGLITPGEEERVFDLVDSLGRVAETHLDLDRILGIAQNAPTLMCQDPLQTETRGARKPKVRIGLLSDSAFSFYYPENLEALEAAGAELVFTSALKALKLPPCDALYIGGGFPETHATALARNRPFRESLYGAAEAGLPVYAECGGLLYMGESLSYQGVEYPMTGIFPVKIEMTDKPQGHGYTRFLVDGENPFFEKGTRLRGHEFHYSRLDPGRTETVFEVKRGIGCGGSRDGLLRWNVLGTYFHIHALGCPHWAQGIISAAERYRKE